MGYTSGFNMGVQQDLKNSNRFIVDVSQGGLGLPNRDYYFNTDERTKKIRAAYPIHMAKMLSMVYGDSSKANKMSSAILQLETDMAASHKN